MKISTTMIKRILGFIGVVCLLAPLTVFAQGDMMIVPVVVNKPLKNVITVAKANGKFTGSGGGGEFHNRRFCQQPLFGGDCSGGIYSYITAADEAVCGYCGEW